MQFKVITHLFALALVCLGTASCGTKSGAGTFTNPASTTMAQTLTRGNEPPVRQAAKKEKDAFELFQEEIRSYLYQEKFDLLESTASKLRASKERFPGGAWKLNAFYAGLGTPEGNGIKPQSEWEAHFNKFQKWLSQSPNSITAHVGLSEALLNCAWEGRGRGYSHTVTPEGWQSFEKYSVMAEEVLNAAYRLSKKCPHLYVAMLRLAQGMSWDRSSFNKVFDEAVAFEPTYYYYYRVKATNLLPRWQGQPGEWEQFADEASRKLGGAQGAILYYLITTHIQPSYGTSFFEQNRVSWPKIKEGYIALEKTYGTDRDRINEICLLSVMARDLVEVCKKPTATP